MDLSEAIGREIFKQGVFDIAVSEIAWRLLEPGGKALDVGANIGYLTGLFAMRLGTRGMVHAFEPHPQIQQILKGNITRIGLNLKSAPVVMHTCALGDVTGSARLIESDYFKINHGTAKISEGASDNETHSYSISMETLDKLFPVESFDLVKIDVEGFEARVLKGAERLLREKRIRHILYEDHDMEHSGLCEKLQSEGYSVFSIGYNLFGPKLQELDQEIAINRSWESPNFLATIEPVAAKKLAGRWGWRALGRFT